VSISGEIEFDSHEIIAHLCSKNVELSALNERLEELLAPEEKKSLPAVMPQRPEKLNENIHNDASKGDIDSVRYLLAWGNSLVEKLDYDNYTPLHHAAEKGHSVLWSLLIEKPTRSSKFVTGRGYLRVEPRRALQGRRPRIDTIFRARSFEAVSCVPTGGGAGCRPPRTQPLKLESHSSLFGDDLRRALSAF
jgi:ankyrin repeat protein